MSAQRHKAKRSSGLHRFMPYGGYIGFRVWGLGSKLLTGDCLRDYVGDSMYVYDLELLLPISLKP